MHFEAPGTRFTPAAERRHREALVARVRAAPLASPAWVVCADAGRRVAFEEALAAAGGGFARLMSLEDFALALDARLGADFAQSPEAHARAHVLERCLEARGVTLSGADAAGAFRTALALLPVVDLVRAHGWDGVDAPPLADDLPPDAAHLVAAHVELLGDLVQEHDAWLLAASSLDAVARLRRAARLLARGDGALEGLVALEGFDRVTPCLRDVLDALARRGATVLTPPWLDAPARAPDPRDAAHPGGLLDALSEAAPRCAVDDGSVSLAWACDPWEEAELTAEWIAERCARGASPESHAVLVDPSHGGVDRVRRALARRGVTARGGATTPVRETVPWQVFCASVRLAWRGVDVFDLATVLSAPGAGVWGADRERLVAMLRREVPGNWHAVRTLLDAFAAPHAGGDAEDPAVLARRARTRDRASELVDLWSWHGPFRRLVAGETLVSLAAVVRETLARFMNPARHVDAVRDPRAQTLWIESVARVSEAARVALTRRVDAGITPEATPAAFLAEVEALLGDASEAPPTTRGDGVAVAASPWELTRRPDVLVVLGFTRGRFPPPAPVTLLLGPLERAALAGLGGPMAALPTEADRAEDARRATLRTLALATARVLLVAPRRSASGDALAPSLAWRDVLATLPDADRAAREAAGVPSLRRWIDDDLGGEARDPTRARDAAVRALGAGDADAAAVTYAPVAARAQAARDFVRARTFPERRYDVGDLVRDALTTTPWSPRALEALLACRYAFLTTSLLGLRALRASARPALGTSDRVRVAVAAVRRLDASGDPAQVQPALDAAVTSEVPWAASGGHDVALLELRRAVERFLHRYVAAQRALGLGRAAPAEALEPVAVALPGARARQVLVAPEGLRVEGADGRPVALDLRVGSTRGLAKLREHGLDLAPALAAHRDEVTSVVRLSLHRADGDIVSRAPRRHGRGDGSHPEPIAAEATLDLHRAQGLAALAAELDALLADGAAYPPHDEARAATLEKLHASQCPRCPMRLGCRFRMAGGDP